MVAKPTAAKLKQPAPRFVDSSAPSPLDVESGTVRIAKNSPRRLPLFGTSPEILVETAVELFSRQHEHDGLDAKDRYYRNLIPLEKPGPGEQYAFQVDLDACTGCKACVTACHVMNGLDEGETFRSVGLLLGGPPDAPVKQTVTSACHHCVEPACLAGCPVGAYEKSPLTGIVKHLDDQCIGCQYCTLMCPYDVPKYNEARGIVRKCDMCSDRLAHDEAPACVDACPNDAISIRTVSQASAISAADAGVFLPGVASPKITLPTSVYSSIEAMPSSVLPADYYRSTPGHWHVPLMVMLTLTQLSTGTFGLALVSQHFTARLAGDPLWSTAFAGAVTLVALIASLFHLGRPALAWRVVLGLRTSWLSREALAFGLFFKALLVCTALDACGVVGWLGPALRALPGGAQLIAAHSTVQLVTAAAGLLGVYCSVMVYVATKRAQWSGILTGFKFFGTTLVLGAAGVLLLVALGVGPARGFGSEARALAGCVSVVAAIKLALEGAMLRDASARQHSARKQMAGVMLGALRTVTGLRFGAGSTGIAFALLLSSGWLSERLVAPAAAIVLVALGAGELLERGLFFSASPT